MARASSDVWRTKGVSAHRYQRRGWTGPGASPPRATPRATSIRLQKTKGPAGMRKISVFLFRDRNPVSKLGRWTTSSVQHLATENPRLFCRKGDPVHSGRSSGRVRGGPCAGVSRAMIVRSRGWTRMVLTRLRPWTSHCARDAQVPAQGRDLRPFDDSLAGRAGGERAGRRSGARSGRGRSGRAGPEAPEPPSPAPERPVSKASPKSRPARPLHGSIGPCTTLTVRLFVDTHLVALLRLRPDA